MHIVICEDEHCFQRVICNAIDDWKHTSGQQDVSYTCFASSEDLLASWESGLSVELLFLDIQIPGELSGMALAKIIRQRDPTVSIVFVTNYSDYVFEGYVVNALRYLKKPVNREDIFQCLDIAYRRFSLLSEKKLSIVRRDQRLVIPYCDIVYIEIQSHYLQLTLYQSTDKPEIRARLRDFAAALPQSLFCQCHRSYIVNVDHIRRFTKDSLTLSNHATIPVSQTFVSMLKKRYDWYYTGKRAALR